jgi:preprotein translocase subunit SecE
LVEHRSPKPGVGGSSPSWPDFANTMKKGNIIQRMRAYLSEIRSELKKVTWPNMNDLQKTTIAVIVLSIIIGIYLQVVDISFQKLVQWIIGIFKEI